MKNLNDKYPIGLYKIKHTRVADQIFNQVSFVPGPMDPNGMCTDRVTTNVKYI